MYKDFYIYENNSQAFEWGNYFCAQEHCSQQIQMKNIDFTMHIGSTKSWLSTIYANIWKEGNVLFMTTVNTFYLLI